MTQAPSPPPPPRVAPTSSPDVTLAPAPSTSLEATLATLPDARGTTMRARAAAVGAVLDDVVGTARTSIPGWDNLAWVTAFARAAARAKAALPSTTHALERRALAARLLRLVPPALLPSSTRDLVGYFAFADALVDRGDDDFAFVAGDAPVIHPSWTAFLTHTDVVDGALRPGRHERLLAPRSLSPGASHTGSPLLVHVDDVAHGAAKLTVHGPSSSSQRRLTSDGRDAGPAELKLDVLSSWLTAAGAGARGLDLRRADDRALLLAFQETLRARKLDGLLARSVDAATTPAQPERRADVIEAVIDAAADTVAFATLDPFAVRLCLPDVDWGREAARVLDATGLVVDVTPRAGSAGRQLVWLDAIADGGFVGGALSAVGQARAFARLAVSVLAPLGALPNVSSRDGNGVVVTLLFEDETGGRARGPWWVEPSSSEVRVPLAAAWQAGSGRNVVEPRGGFSHDVAALPGWLGSFVDTIASAGEAD